MSNQGNYEFYVSAASGSDSENAVSVTVNYDTSGPGTPNYYSKEHPEQCKYIIRFHTADDNGATNKVEIYSSDQKNFDTNNGSRVGTVNIGSNQDGIFTHDRADSCDREWYYVIRAFDVAGNQSDARGDELTKTTIVSPSPVAGALIITKATGSVLGKKDESTPSESGTVLATDSTISSTSPSPSSNPTSMIAKSKLVWWLIPTAIALGLLYVIARKKITR
jgi:hypothetical protein